MMSRDILNSKVYKFFYIKKFGGRENSEWRVVLLYIELKMIMHKPNGQYVRIRVLVYHPNDF
jgi:hypothetical protein